MRYTKSKHFVKTKLTEDYSINSVAGYFERDEDNPLSLKRLSKTFLGLLIAFVTILLPSISIFFARSSSQENELVINHSIKKDGS